MHLNFSHVNKSQSKIISTPSDDYKQHTSCITEAERYEKTVYKGPRKNETQGRKLTPQETWNEVIQNSSTKCPPFIANYIDALCSLDNVPRKEKPFRNFATNSLRLRGPNGNATITEIWKHLCNVKEEMLKAQQTQKGAIADTEEKSESKTQENPETEEGTEKNIQKEKKKNDKKVAKAMKKALKKAPSKQLNMKELRKLVKKNLESDDINMSKDTIKVAISQAISEDKSLSSEGKIVTMLG